MFSDLLYRLRALFRRKALDSELDEELQYHLDREAEKYRQLEASPELAMRRAKLCRCSRVPCTRLCTASSGAAGSRLIGR